MGYALAESEEVCWVYLLCYGQYLSLSPNDSSPATVVQPS
jgi:hypothetical protein